MLATLLLAICMSTAGESVPDDDPLKITAEMKQFLDTRLDPGTDRLQLLQTLVRMLFQENALNFTYVPETRTAAETFAKRGGNCVSFTFLFIAMARHLGYDARFREVDIIPTWSRIGNITSVSGHANAAVFVGSQAYVVDLFPRVNAIQLGGRIVSDGRAVAHFLNNRGVDRISIREFREAITYFEKALESDPTTPSVWANMGVAHSLLNDSASAERCYLKSLEMDSGELVAMSNLASLYNRTGRYREANRFQAKVRKFNQKNPYYHFALGMQSYQAGDYKQSIGHYRAALKLKSEEHHFHLAIAKAYSQLGFVDKAARSLRLAIKNAPDDASKAQYNEKLAYLASRQQGT